MIIVYEYYLEEDFKSHMKKHWKKYALGGTLLATAAAAPKVAQVYDDRKRRKIERSKIDKEQKKLREEYDKILKRHPSDINKAKEAERKEEELEKKYKSKEIYPAEYLSTKKKYFDDFYGRSHQVDKNIDRMKEIEDKLSWYDDFKSKYLK